MRHTVVTAGAFAFSTFSACGYAQAYLENPQPNSSQSGISVVSGWHCDASLIEFQIDDRRMVPVPYGSERKDTEGVCGDWDNGFSFLLNYSGMGDGTHTITVYADGVPFASSTFQVAALGDEFIRGVERGTVVTDFPTHGVDTVLGWQEASQNFHVVSSGQSNSLVGSWATPYGGVLTFHSNGTYNVYETGACDKAGIEAGEYTYDADQRRIVSLSVFRDENGDCGLADYGNANVDGRIWHEGDTLYYIDDFDPEDRAVMPRIP